MSADRLRVFVLLAFDPATRCATRPVGVVGLAALHRAEVSWVPLEHVAAQTWTELVAAAGEDLGAAIDEWRISSNGVSSDVVEVAAPEAADLRGAVEIVMDELLAVAGPGDGRWGP